MWKQITNLNGDEVYLIASLWIFFIFFIVVALMLFAMKKDFAQYMKRIPLEEKESEIESENESE